MGRLPFFQKMKVHLDASKQSLHFFRVLWASNNVELDKFDTLSQLSNLFVIIFLCYSKKCMASDWALLCPADLLSIEVEKVGD